MLFEFVETRAFTNTIKEVERKQKIEEQKIGSSIKCYKEHHYVSVSLNSR